MELTDEMLSQCAAEASALWLAQVLDPDAPPHRFSRRFERRMAALLRRQRHSPRQRRARTFARRAAAVVLILLLGLGAFLAVDTEARAAVLQWVRETFSHSVIYRFPEHEAPAPVPRYTLGWVPEGFVLVDSGYDETAGECFYLYEEIDGRQSFSFDAISMFDGTIIELFNIDDPSKIEAVLINGMRGEFCPANGPMDYSGLTWFDETRQVALMVDGNISKEDILHIAQEVKLEESTK